MSRVRNLRQEDIPEIVRLNMGLFPRDTSLSFEEQAARFQSVCFQNPWMDTAISCLVHEEGDGRISGFLGVVPRTMVFQGQTIRAAVGQHLMVDRSTLASFQLFRAFLSGPQEFSLADMAIDITRPTWERAGGVTSFVHSIHWRLVLRPLRSVANYVRKRRTFGVLAATMMPLWNAIDAVAGRIPGPFSFAAPQTSMEELTVESFISNFPLFSDGLALRPSYDNMALSWLFDRLSEERRFGELRKKLVRDRGGRVLGWFIYFSSKKERSEVLQIAATKSTAKDVIQQLFYLAWSEGSAELCGRMDPRFMKEFSRSSCYLTPGKNWMLVHSKIPDLLHAVNRGDAFLTRLEGDLWLL